MSTTLLVIFPASVGLAVAAEPIVSMLYLHGAYAWSDVQNTSLTLQAFALSIPAVAMIRLQTSVFFSLKDTRTPVKVSLFSILLTGLLGWWWSQSLEIFGLAWGLLQEPGFSGFCCRSFCSSNPNYAKIGGPCGRLCFIFWLQQEWEVLPGIPEDMDHGKTDLFLFTTG